MNSNHLSPAFHYARYLCLALASVFLMTACSSGASRIQTWDGAVESPANLAVLEAPGAIKIREVNGKPISSFLIDNLALDYELLPGENRVVFTYKSIWSKTEVVDNGESKVHVVESENQVVSIDARPGETYRFEFERPASRQQAKKLAEDFSATVVSSGGQVVATSMPWSAKDPEQVVARAPVLESKAAKDPQSEVSDTTLDRLKTLWGKASEAEKREFLRWAFE